MEGVLFFPPDRPRRHAEIACADCGQMFRPRRMADGVEELCDSCYQAQFMPTRLRRWQSPRRSADHAR